MDIKMDAITNFEAQPPRMFNHQHVQDREINVLIRICRGLLSDGSINQFETEFLKEWITSNRHLSNAWPANDVYSTLNKTLEDNVLDSEEEKELLALLYKVICGKHDEETGEHASTILPFDDPQPILEFDNKNYILTGKFDICTRKNLDYLLNELGARATKEPSSKTHYLVVGSIDSRDWKYSSFGRKIKKAVELQSKGRLILIVSEDTFMNALVETCIKLLLHDSLTLITAHFLKACLTSNRHLSNRWATDDILAKLDLFFDYGITNTEHSQLSKLIHEISHGKHDKKLCDKACTSQYIDDPQPILELENKTYVLTGTFASTSRNKLEELLSVICVKTTKVLDSNSDYLVIGSNEDANWRSDKIDSAINLKSQGHPLLIVSEWTLIKALQQSLDDEFKD